jgi:prevent-host-death family protein
MTGHAMMAKMAIIRSTTMQVSATEAKNRFGYFCSCAKSEPVIVEKDGRPDTVLIGYEDYEALMSATKKKSLAQRRKDFNEKYKEWIKAQNEDFDQHGIWSDGLVPWQQG